MLRSPVETAEVDQSIEKTESTPKKLHTRLYAYKINYMHCAQGVTPMVSAK